MSASARGTAPPPLPRRPLPVRAALVVARNVLLLSLPPRVALFYSRARRLATRCGDEWALHSSTKPESLISLMRLARGRREVVEIGTGTAWSSISFALADAARRVRSYDPDKRPERERYLALVPPAVRGRIEFITAPGETGPEPGAPPFDMIFIDGAHHREAVLADFHAWRPAAKPGAVFAFHDYGNSMYPGVKQAVEELGLEGRAYHDVFVWHAPGD